MIHEPCDKYTEMLPRWSQMRDAVEGEDKIKSKGTLYLPAPTGLEQADNYKAAYQSYKCRARYPEVVGPAVEGMVGLMSRKETLPELPEAMKYLQEKATPDGLTLEGLKRRIEHEACTVGRIVLFVDIHDDKPYISTYTAESVTKWRPDLVVFEEQVEEPDPNDKYETISKTQWRSAEIEDGYCIIRTWEKEAKDKKPVMISEYTPTVRGDRLDYIPAVFIGSRDLLQDPDAIPLEGVARQANHYYRQYADYAMQLYMSANGTMPYFWGVQESEVPTCVGPDQVVYSTNESASAGYIEIAGAGIDAQKKELDEIKKDMAINTMSVLGERKAAEAAEALRLRFQSQTATLGSIARSVAAGLETALRICAFWLNIEGDQIQVVPNTAFIREEPDPQLIQALGAEIERGRVPDDILIEYLRRVEMHDMDADEFRKWSPAAMALPDEDE